MSRCVEKSFAPCWQCGRTRVFRPVPPRAVTAWDERVFCYGGRKFCRSKPNAAPP